MGIFDRFLLTEKKQKKDQINVLDIKNIDANDGDSIVVSGVAGNTNNLQFIQYERGQNETNRIETYRNIANAAEIDEVITDIINETFIFQNDKKAFELDWFPSAEISDILKEKIYEEFENIYSIMNFDDIGSELLQSFYIDGRIVFQLITGKNTKKGFAQIVKLDPLNIVKVKVIPPRDRATQKIDYSEVKELYVYSNKKFANQKNYLNNIMNYEDIVEGLQLDPTEITYVTSGLVDSQYNMTIGHLDKAIVPYNNLKMMEQSMVIFRVVRAPMRRAFYVDVSGLPKNRAEQYMKEMSNRFTSKLVYNTETGSWVDQQSVISVVEDYFIPRFNDSKTTEITNVEGQSSQEILEEVNYMKDKLYQSLNSPKSRYTEEGNVFIFGKSDQIPRDEYRFKKFIGRLRNRFMLGVDDILLKQLLLKGIISESDWPEIKSSFFWRFSEDNAFIEFKDAEIMNNRIDTALKYDDLIEKGYYSKIWIRKNILMQSDDLIMQIDAELYKEKNQNPDEPPENYDEYLKNNTPEGESESDDASNQDEFEDDFKDASDDSKSNSFSFDNSEDSESDDTEDDTAKEDDENKTNQ